MHCISLFLYGASSATCFIVRGAALARICQQHVQAFLKFCDIDKIESSSLDLEQFVEQYEAKNIPVVIKNAVNDWQALKRWNSGYLSTASDIKNNQDSRRGPLFRATSATAPMAANFTLAGYFKYSRQACEEAPLYLLRGTSL